MALGAAAAVFIMTLGGTAQTGDRAAVPVGAVIKSLAEAACFLEKDMGADFFGNGGAVPSRPSSDCLKGSRFIQHGFNNGTFSK